MFGRLKLKFEIQQINEQDWATKEKDSGVTGEH
jgi:hypothetical protein